ncbi:MAG: hypothetical protein GKC07_09075 [Methanomicrobiales archaeon]|nr:hypothetical protein [Methanomicrobiales archaeon]
MGCQLKVIRHLRSFWFLATRRLVLRTGSERADPDIMQLMDLRRDIERMDRSALSRISCRPMQYSGPWGISDDSRLPPESFLPGRILPVTKDIEDIIRAETAEEG